MCNPEQVKRVSTRPCEQHCLHGQVHISITATDGAERIYFRYWERSAQRSSIGGSFASRANVAALTPAILQHVEIVETLLVPGSIDTMSSAQAKAEQIRNIILRPGVGRSECCRFHPM